MARDYKISEAIGGGAVAAGAALVTGRLAKAAYKSHKLNERKSEFDTKERERQAKAAAEAREKARKDRVSGFNMTPSQKAAYLNNPGMDNY